MPDQCALYLNYVERISASEHLFHQYRFRAPETVRPETKKERLIKIISENPGRVNELPIVEQFLDNFELSEILFSFFGTGIGFLEFKVEYGNLPIDCIIDFAYLFKNMRGKNHHTGKLLEDIAYELLPQGNGICPFFYYSDEKKHDCLCYHLIKLSAEEIKSDQTPRRLFDLGRSYSSSFPFSAEKAQSESPYDFNYSPYENDLWNGSQESLVNMVFELGEAKDNIFLRYYKYNHLTNDYHFLYLLALNQRFSAIKYIDQLVEFDLKNAKHLNKLNEKIIRLKTVYSLRIVSGDLLMQNVYSRIYQALDIDNLLKDLQDNEEQMELLQNKSSVHFKQFAGALLFAVSILTVFSALIDAASYFSLFPDISGPAKWLSLICITAAIVIGIVFGLITNRKNR